MASVRVAADGGRAHAAPGTTGSRQTVELGASDPAEPAVAGSLELGTGQQRGPGHLLEHLWMVEDDLEIGPRQQRMLAAEALRASALAALDRVDQA